ncbi:hypothetical protein K458DRAFT_167946 [Lentithecium fluviatile CBS 122367]|uniref:Secreted protein n=1 Tax=Lentithecium fluviatile CBS 122367 TaxID=1168545 RepID=A0A6G1JC08_9PLEO|nr:hypothetical protein K458DRAFT_167946 [Lentithecium fluviatile CBS 122367]
MLSNPRYTINLLVFTCSLSGGAVSTIHSITSCTDPLVHDGSNGQTRTLHQQIHQTRRVGLLCITRSRTKCSFSNIFPMPCSAQTSQTHSVTPRHTNALFHPWTSHGNQQPTESTPHKTRRADTLPNPPQRPPNKPNQGTRPPSKT